MFGKINKIWIISGFIFLHGCTTTKIGPRFSEAVPAEPLPGHAILYIFRETAQPYIYSPAISIDSQKVIDLPHKTYTWVYIKPGRKKISADWSLISSATDVETYVFADEGEEYFIEVISTIGSAFSKQYSQLKRSYADKTTERLKKCCRIAYPISKIY